MEAAYWLRDGIACPANALLLARVQTILSGVGFFADAFDLFVINIVKNILADLYPQSTAQASGLATAALVGAVIGQLVFGALADQLGRRIIFVVTISLVILTSIGSALCFDSEAVGIYTQLFIWRGLLGFAIGGADASSRTGWPGPLAHVRHWECMPSSQMYSISSHRPCMPARQPCRRVPACSDRDRGEGRVPQ